MGHTLRTFVAIRCPPDVCGRMRKEAQRLAQLDGAFKAPRTDDFHITVQFLGHTAEEDVVAISQALGRAAALCAPFEMAYEGLGAFPTPDRARVVWAGARELEDTGAFAFLAEAVGEELEGLGFYPEKRAFHPHVTLGRVRRKPDAALVEAVSAGEAIPFGLDEVSELKLILSQPGNRGYSYIDLTTVDLGTSANASPDADAARS